jgi:ketosteroid isomerase-like protein
MDTAQAALIDRFYEALSRRDFDGVLAMCDEGVRLYNAPGVEEMSLTPDGRERVSAYLRGWLDSWETYDRKVEELREMGEEEVVALVSIRARGRGSTFDIEEDVADVFGVKDGRIVSLRLHVSRDEALPEAAQ